MPDRRGLGLGWTDGVAEGLAVGSVAGDDGVGLGVAVAAGVLLTDAVGLGVLGEGAGARGAATAPEASTRVPAHRTRLVHAVAIMVVRCWSGGPTGRPP